MKMQTAVEKKELVRQLQAKINAMQGLGKAADGLQESLLSPFASAFPGHVFPRSALHEFISYELADAACTSGFITALMGKFMKEGGLCLWVGNGKKVFPPGLKHFGIEPDRIVFIDIAHPKHALWTIEEALKCEALTAVVGEIKELGFTESRRLQLAVERSGITGFLHRFRPHTENALAATTRWKVKPMASQTELSLPGVGHSCWEVQLLKVRNGRPASWQISWRDKAFVSLTDEPLIVAQEKQAG